MFFDRGGITILSTNHNESPFASSVSLPLNPVREKRLIVEFVTVVV
jgi:hypothetical protein